MKTSRTLLALALGAVIALPFGRMAKAEDQMPVQKDVIVSVSDAYIPGGFDSTADAYVVVNGIFPNGCYKWKKAEVTNKDAFNHDISSMASVSQGMCLMVLVPFTKEVRLGKLDSGTHTLHFLNGDGTYLEKTLTIE